MAMAMAMAMVGQLNITLLLLLLLNVKAESSSVVYPAYPCLDSGFCSSSSPHSSPSAPSPNYSNHVRKRSSIIDITHSIRPDLPDWGSQEGVGNLIKLVASIPNGDLANQSELKIGVHTGTHVDAPSHIFQEYYEAGDHLDTLDLHVLNGLALVVDVPRDTNITAEAMQALHIPYGVERVLFRTLNTDRRLMWKKEFDTSYVAFTSDGAQWLRDNTKIKLIGVDYLSAAAFDYLIPAHVVLLQNKDIILVEGLNLDNVDVGLYDLHCLPLIIKTDGSPIRCILEK